MYKIIAISLMLFIGTFSTSAISEEVVMSCTNDGSTVHMKYSNPMIGFKRIYQRVDGEWVRWEKEEDIEYEVFPALKITNKGAKLKWAVRVLTRDQTAILHRTIIVDFEFITRRMEKYYTEPHSGEALFSTTPNNPEVVNYQCSLPKQN